MGKGDMRTSRGKRVRGTFGKSRSREAIKARLARKAANAKANAEKMAAASKPKG